MEKQTISFNVSKTINIGNFEAVKLNYGESRTVDPNRDIDEQRQELIKDCYTIIGNEAKAWEGIKTIQKVTSNKKIKH
tara:strand:+ start:459 stop:692 length:234 start_codon:yes stop_codon:yes gene_type:complete